ncbi:deoxyribonuclease-1-like isoform X3 [Epinephelus moara]|uniref:deoxyribonuclease-1-like isoform X3 n=1 Tax=Epinephelus moara TaxID=300413 RepID=UPI00214F4A60|nr:deoxyribonuclease-1-like isoform X3 [Epinephelus moara]
MKIAAFNAKNLGWKKVTNKTVVHYLTKIMSQYSVVVILEVMDKSGKAMQKLLKELNNNSSNKNCPYSMTASSRLGRDTYKERFVCFYREDDVKLKACHQYEDNQVGDVDAFAREPFILRFRCPSTKVKDLVLIPVHTKPKDSLKELDELHDVVNAVRKKWRTNKIMILGDFNADGRYLSKRKKKKIRISSAPYHWLIKDDVDTTTSNCNDHTYDRIVVYRKTMLDAVVPGSAKPFNFQKEFNLTDEQTLSISDHYPVEVELRTNQKAPAQEPMALPRTTKTTSIKRQTQKKGAQKKRRAKPAGAEKRKKIEAAGADKKKKKPEVAGAEKKKTKAKPAGAEKKKKTEAAGAEKRKKIEAAGADKKKKKPEVAGAEKKKTKAKPAGAEKKKKTEAAGAEKKKKAEAAGAEKKKKTEPAGAEKKKKTEAAGAEKKKAEAAGAEKKKKAEAAGAEKKKKAEAAALQKTKNMTGKRTRGPSSDTPAKRRRLEKCQSNRLSTSCLTQ